MASSITSMSAMTRSRETWPAARAKAKRRRRERKTIARRAQAERDQKAGRGE